MKRRKKIGIAASVCSIPILGAAINFLMIHLATNKTIETAEMKEFFHWRLGKIHYLRKGIGKPVLLIHDIHSGMNYKQWYKNIDSLSEKYQVFALDLLGFGYSDKPKITYTAYMYGCLINDFIMNVIRRPTAVIACRYSSIFVLSAYAVHPQNFKKLFFIEPKGFSETLPRNTDQIRKFIVTVPILGTLFYNLNARKTVYNQYLSDQVYWGSEAMCDSPLAVSMYHSSHYQGYGAKYATASFATNFMNLSVKHIFSSIRIPLFVSWGEQISLELKDEMEALTKMNPHGEYFIFEQSKHLPNIENSVKFNQLIKELFH